MINWDLWNLFISVKYVMIYILYWTMIPSGVFNIMYYAFYIEILELNIQKYLKKTESGTLYLF